MPKRDVVVVAASAGGIEALRELLAGLPADFGGSVLVVLHLASQSGSALPAILDRAGPLRATAAVDGEPLAPGRVYVCPSDHHLLLGEGHVQVRRGPRENGHRPAADPLFRSAARCCGARAIGVVLSGMLSDGTAGLQAIRRVGGIAVVQDPSDALHDGMPTSALDHVGADHVVTAAAMGPLLVRLLAGDDRQDDDGQDDGRQDDDRDGIPTGRGESVPGRPSPWPCPDCHGVLWEIQEEGVLGFRCRTGHAWGADSLLHEQGGAVEAALWMALRSLQDRAALGIRLAERAEDEGRTLSATRFRSDLDDMDRSIAVLHELLTAEFGRLGEEAVAGA